MNANKINDVYGDTVSCGIISDGGNTSAEDYIAFVPHLLLSFSTSRSDDVTFS